MLDFHFHFLRIDLLIHGHFSREKKDELLLFKAKVIVGNRSIFGISDVAVRRKISSSISRQKGKAILLESKGFLPWETQVSGSTLRHSKSTQGACHGVFSQSFQFCQDFFSVSLQEWPGIFKKKIFLKQVLMYTSKNKLIMNT